MPKIIREGFRFRQDLTVPCYQTDSKFRLKAASFMDMAQEIAMWAAGMLGFGYDELRSGGTAWVLSRMHVVFEKQPLWREDVSIWTWHKGAQGPFFLRDFLLEDKDGNRLAESTSSWVILDTAARSFVRPEHLKEIMTVPDGLGDALEEPAPKLVFPRSLEKRPAGQHTVCYSDVDIIGHTNNARYAVWAMDALEYEVVSERSVRELFINFNKETTPGQVVALSTAKENDDVFWVEGEVDGKQVFIFKLILG